jgi:hypothetical protein
VKDRSKIGKKKREKKENTGLERVSLSTTSNIYVQNTKMDKTQPKTVTTINKKHHTYIKMMLDTQLTLVRRLDNRKLAKWPPSSNSLCVVLSRNEK